jgi:hypothetical protein
MRTSATSGPPMRILPWLWLRVAALVCFAAIGSIGGIAQAAPVSEAQLKAALLFNFAKFVEWPTNALPEAATPFQICILGSDALREELSTITRDRTIGGHRLLVREVQDAHRARGCHILFVSAAGKKQRTQILEGLHGAGVLTVSDVEGFAEQGGMINLVMREGKVQFEINHKAATQEGLVISARLLSLAKFVIE